MSMSSIIKVAILGEAKGIEEAARKAREALGSVETKSKSTGQKLAQYGGAAAAGIAGVALAAAGYAIKAGSELDDSQVLLQNALKDTGQSLKSLGDGYGPLLKANEKWGYTNAVVNDSLNTLVRAGAKGKAALTDEAIAANLAAARHISLGAAVAIVSKVITGHVSLLGRYGLATKDAQGKTLSISAAMAELKGRFGGAADAMGGTFQGKIAATKAQLEDAAAKIGQKLIPILEKLASFIVNTLIPGIGMIVGWVETKMIPALQKFALSVADVYNRYVKPSIDGIIMYFKGLWTIISGVVQLFSDLFHGKFGAIWGDLKNIASGVIESIVGFFEAFPGRILALVPGIASAALKAGESIASGILNGITGAAGDVLNFAKSIVNGLIGYVNRDVIDKIDSVIGAVQISPGFGIHIGLPQHLIPDIPLMDSGGIFNSGQGHGLAMLQDGERVQTRAQQRAGGNIVINMPHGIDPAAVVRAQQIYNRRNGIS
jgi:hypothetical protein